MSITSIRRAEISAITHDIRDRTKELARHGIAATEPHELSEAREIIRRIEERMILNMMADQPEREAAE